MTDILEIAREKALENGEGLNQEELVQILNIEDERLPEPVSYTHLTLPTSDLV